MEGLSAKLMAAFCRTDRQPPAVRRARAVSRRGADRRCPTRHWRAGRRRGLRGMRPRQTYGGVNEPQPSPVVHALIPGMGEVEDRRAPAACRMRAVQRLFGPSGHERLGPRGQFGGRYGNRVGRWYRSRAVRRSGRTAGAPEASASVYGGGFCCWTSVAKCACDGTQQAGSTTASRLLRACGALVRCHKSGAMRVRRSEMQQRPGGPSRHPSVNPCPPHPHGVS